ncbi:MAG: GNAT family N-acetyltransferase [Pyrinomonadaceae bacterium]
MPENSFYLRDHHPEDVPQILSVIKTAFAEQRGLIDPPSSAERKTVEIVEAELRSAKALVVESGGEIVACVFYQPKGDSVYIDRLAVMPRFRRGGIGKTLMEEVERRATETGFEKLSLSVRIELKRQQEYYGKMGFQISSYESHRGFDRSTFVIMEKALTKWI